jgi:hypothetical protein
MIPTVRLGTNQERAWRAGLRAGFLAGLLGCLALLATAGSVDGAPLNPRDPHGPTLTISTGSAKVTGTVLKGAATVHNAGAAVTRPAAADRGRRRPLRRTGRHRERPRVPGTDADLVNLLLPHIDDGWRSP